MKIHLDLFSGIGGFALAVDEVWPGTEHIFCEINPYCQALLKLRFKGAKIYGDIRELRLDTYTDSDRCSVGKEKINTTEGREQIFGNSEKCNGLTADTEKCRLEKYELCKRPTIRQDNKVFILTGGFPCQPFSQAGKRKGTSDNRFLWPEMLRVIREFQPSWVIAENVRGLLTISEGLVFEQVCLDLEGEGYETQPLIIPACAVNAPHRRDRVWFVANRRCERQEVEQEQTERSEQCDSDALNAEPKGLPDRDAREVSRQKQNQECQRPTIGCVTTEQWNQNWLEIATELCRMDDGLPAELDGLKLSKAGHRVERLKALGNAIVPQVAVEIMMAIKATQE